MMVGVNLYSEIADELYNTIVQTYKAGDYNKKCWLIKKICKNIQK